MGSNIKVNLLGQFWLAVTASTTSQAGKVLKVVSEGQVKAEMIIGAFMGAGIFLFYYYSKYKSGNWNSGDPKSVGAIILAVILFTLIVGLLPVK